MTNALEIAYASNNETPIDTIEFSHSGLSGGVLRLAKSFTDLVTEESPALTFSASGLLITLPEKSVNGKPYINIQVDNTNNSAYEQIALVIATNRSSQEEVVCKYRAYVLSDLTQPASAVITLAVTKTVINRKVASITAEYTPIPDTVYPRYRYFPTDFPGVKYVE